MSVYMAAAKHNTMARIRVPCVWCPGRLQIRSHQGRPDKHAVQTHPLLCDGGGG